MSRMQQQRARPGRESSTKETRKGHEKGMVRARFFPPSKCPTPAPVSACAAGKNFVFRDVTDLRDEPNPFSQRLCGSVPRPVLQNEPTIRVHLRFQTRLPNEPTARSAHSLICLHTRPS